MLRRIRKSFALKKAIPAWHTQFGDDHLVQVGVIKFQKDGGLSDKEWAEYTVIVLKLNVLMFFRPMNIRQYNIYFDKFNLHALFVPILQNVKTVK